MMYQRAIGIGCAVAFAASLGSAADAAGREKTLSFDKQRDLISTYCVECHNFEDWAGGLELLAFDPEHPEADAELAEKVIEKLRAGMMPPAGKPRPDFATGQALAASLEHTIDAGAEFHPGWPGLHRLNRVEYENVIRDLLGMEVDAGSFLPTDDSSHGFDNQAGTLGLSPVLLEAYIGAAGDIARLAMGDVQTPSQAVHRVAEDATQNYHVEGLPFGTRGGILFEHVFPADGTYTFKVYSVNVGNMGNFRPFGEVRGEQLEILMDGERVGLFDWDKEFHVGEGYGAEGLTTIDLTIPVTAGPHKIGVTFLARNYAPGLDLNNAFERSTIETGGLPGFTFYPHVGSIRVDGPYDAARPEESPSLARILVCRPEDGAAEQACAEKIVRRLARRAYRGNADEEDIATILSFYEEGREEGGFYAGIEAALQRILSDPKFIYRVETPPEDVAAGGTYRISDLELASRLSFFLWSSMPDDTLLDLAEQGRLSEPRVLEAQVQRMLDDPRADALTRNFAGQWLALRNLSDHAPVVTEFPDFDDNLRQALRRETELFFASIIKENRPALDLLTADYTFVNGRLAKHYGIPGIEGSRFRRVELGPDQAMRRGLLGKGSLLTVSSQPGRTSPVVRGNWVLTNLIGSPPPPPPPDVPAIKPQTSDAAGNAHVPTMREQFEAHRSNPACKGCHMMMDPIGFAMEPFDATGHWRTSDAGQPINAKDVMYDGTPVDGPGDIRDFLVKYKTQFLRTLTGKLMTYAVGRGMEYGDRPMIRSVLRQAAQDDYRFRSLIVSVVESDAFLMNTKPDARLAGG